MSTTPLVFLDTETTCLDRWRRRAWEFAAIRREPDGRSTRLHLMISDVDLADASQIALGIGRFYQRHPLWSSTVSPLGAPPERVPQPGEPTLVPERVAALAIEWITRGAQIVGSNPEFDVTTLSSMFHRHGLIPSWHYQPWCVKSMVAGKTGILPSNQSHAAALMSIPSPVEQEHTAMGDVEVCRSIFDAVMGSAPL